MKRDQKEYDDKHIGVTELLGCMRKSWQRRRNPKPLTKKQMVIFFRGQLFDNIYTPLFKRNQVRVTHRVLDAESLIISGRLDFVDIDGTIADWKTVDGTYFVERDGAKPEHISQLLFYCWCEANERARLYYMSLSNLIKIDIDASIEKQKENLEMLELKAMTYQVCLLTNTIPPIDDKHNPNYWECCYGKGNDKTYCEYYEECYEK
jgi:CRISPR-associated exonuclease Cas4